MANPTTSIFLNQATPAAPSGDQNVVFQSDNAFPQQSVTAYPKRMVGDTGSGGSAGTVPPPAAGDAAAGKFLKADGTWAVPAGGGGGGGGGGTPVIRGSGLQASSASSYTVTWPTGTLAGDLALIFVGHAWSINKPAGWVLVDSNIPVTNYNGATFSRVLTSADIAAGSVTVTVSNTFDGVVGIVTFVGATGGIRPPVTSIANSSGSSSVTVNSDGSPLTADMAVYFGGNRGASTATVSLGSMLQQANDLAFASGCIYAGSPASAGGVSPVFSYSTAGTANYQIIVVVKG
jgi:hypothetical protein